MRGVFDDRQLEPAPARRDTELTLGSGTLLAIFFGLVLLCGLCFGLGYAVGHRGTQPLRAANCASRRQPHRRRESAQSQPPSRRRTPRPRRLRRPRRPTADARLRQRHSDTAATARGRDAARTGPGRHGAGSQPQVHPALASASPASQGSRLQHRSARAQPSRHA